MSPSPLKEGFSSQVRPNSIEFKTHVFNFQEKSSIEVQRSLLMAVNK